MNNIVKQAQRMQAQIAKVQEDMNDREVEASAGGGAVIAVVNGRQELVALTLQPEMLASEDAETVQELVVSAVNLALGNMRDLLQTEVNRITGGLQIPGLF
jgi:DNA-binding YbaB/EbfC family protein